MCHLDVKRISIGLILRTYYYDGLLVKYKIWFGKIKNYAWVLIGNSLTILYILNIGLELFFLTKKSSIRLKIMDYPAGRYTKNVCFFSIKSILFFDLK